MVLEEKYASLVSCTFAMPFFYTPLYKDEEK